MSPKVYMFQEILCCFSGYVSDILFFVKRIDAIHIRPDVGTYLREKLIHVYEWTCVHRRSHAPNLKC